MRKTQSLSITLPHEMAQLIKDKVASGGYATESEVIRDGLRALQERDAAVEQWLRTEGIARYDAYHADPSRLMSAEETWSDLQRHIKARNKKRTVTKAG
jgi:putative addiction module CopG family antidote